MVALEGAVNVAPKLLSLKHGRKWVICSLSDQDLHTFSVVGNRAECPLVSVTEASHCEGVFLLNIKGWCSFFFYRFLGTPHCRRDFVQCGSAHNKWICAASAAVRKKEFFDCARPGGYQTQRQLKTGCWLDVLLVSYHTEKVRIFYKKIFTEGRFMLYLFREESTDPLRSGFNGCVDILKQ